MPNAILDPTGQADRTSGGSAFTLAPRRAGLRGARVGLLINTKRNADFFLEEVGRLLEEEQGAGSVMARTKLAFAQPVPADMLKELTTECDVVVTGVGDCGSCSASAVTDGIMLESKGIPAAVICSDAFGASADAIAALRGAPGYHYLTTPHPVAVLTPGEVRDRARQLLPDIVSLLAAGGEAAGGEAAA
ncbi:MAG TPA: hypothetical protein DHU96_19815 [Actinobacteria bacterium]|nr:hypothetical protein [Actinomycetota bacterium]